MAHTGQRREARAAALHRCCSTQSTSSHHCNDDDETTVGWEPPFCNGSRRLSTEAKGSRRVEGGHREEEEEGKKEGGKVQPQQPDGEEGAPARPTEGQKVLWKKMGAVERISELNESSNGRARPFPFTS